MQSLQKDSLRPDRTVGIIGGMGPEATIDLMQRILKLTPAHDDSDHIRCIVDNNPKIPSRIKAIIENNGEDPSGCLADMAKRLETAGSDFLAIACNTAHHYFDVIQKAVDIPVVHMVEAVLSQIEHHHPQCRMVGILGSPAIRITALYDRIFSPRQIGIIYPDDDYQDRLFRVIRAVKAGNTGTGIKNEYLEVCRHLETKGVALGVAACTELSVLSIEPSIQMIDAAQVLAAYIVDLAKHRTKFK